MPMPFARWLLVGAVALAAPAPTTSPPPRLAAAEAEPCGSCHELPPATGAHPKHARKGVACAECHGEGYRNGATDAELHQNGASDVATAAAWNPARRTCANECHHAETWRGSKHHREREEKHRKREREHTKHERDDD
jgi:hypothetical protein